MNFSDFIAFVLQNWAQHLFWGTIGILTILGGVLTLLTECIKAVVNTFYSQDEKK